MQLHDCRPGLGIISYEFFSIFRYVNWLLLVIKQLYFHFSTVVFSLVRSMVVAYYFHPIWTTIMIRQKHKK